MYRIPWLLLPLTLGGSAAPIDADHDTFPVGLDCDDGDVHAHPHAPERANGRDDDCNGRVDDEVWNGLGVTRWVERTAVVPAAPVAVWSFLAGRGVEVYDAGPLALDGRLSGGRWSDTGLTLDGGWVTLAHPELERTRLRWVVRFRTVRGGTLLSRGSGGAGALPDAADSYALFVGRELVAEVAGRRWRAAVDLRDGEWHVVELGVGPRVELVADDVLLVEDDAEPPVYDGTPTLLGADIDGGVAVRPFLGELAEARLEAE